MSLDTATALIHAAVPVVEEVMRTCWLGVVVLSLVLAPAAIRAKPHHQTRPLFPRFCFDTVATAQAMANLQHSGAMVYKIPKDQNNFTYLRQAITDFDAGYGALVELGFKPAQFTQSLTAIDAEIKALTNAPGLDLDAFTRRAAVAGDIDSLSGNAMTTITKKCRLWRRK
jgi:hypothetical protein